MSDTREIIFVNYILDNVHGFIGLTKIEDQIERLPIFKRLQDISQLGLVKRIFPGALHNRYIHSLGVMYVIDQMALHLKVFNSAERQLLRLAGMLHDLGHYPLSHDVEQVYEMAGQAEISGSPSVRQSLLEETNKNIKKIIDIEMESLSPDDKNIVDKIQKPEKELVVKKPTHHESVTSEVIRNSKSIKKYIVEGIQEGFFNEEGNDWKLEKDNKKITDFADKIICDICALIQGDGDYKYETGAFPRYFTAMMQLLHSELDADRIDYLLRDATFSGASYGTFDVGILMQNLTMQKYTIGSKTAWIVGVKGKGIGCADQYMVNRYLAYTQVIFNKYTSVVGKMLREVVLWMMDSSKIRFYSFREVLKMIKEQEENEVYLAFTDSYFFQNLSMIHKEDGCPSDIYCFVEQLKKYSALGVEYEDVFSGNLERQQSHILSSEFYKHVIELEENEMADSENALYLFNNKKITNHMPIGKYKRNFELYNETHEKKLSYDEYQMDRLMDGLAVIRDNEEPVLLIDAPGSMMREMYDIQQVMLRKYLLPNNLK